MECKWAGLLTVEVVKSTAGNNYDKIIGASAASPYLVNFVCLSVCLCVCVCMCVCLSWTGSILASKDDALYRVDCYVSYPS